MTEDSSSHRPTKRIHVYSETSRRADLEFVCIFGHDALLGHDVEFAELKKDLDELVKLLFVKGQAWSYEQEIRLLVDLNRTTRLQSTDDCGFPIHVFEVSAEAIEDVYVGFDTPTEQIRRIEQVVGVGEGRWRLKYTHWHAYLCSAKSRSSVDWVLPPLSVGEMTLRLYGALNYSQNSARDLRCAVNGA